MFYIKYIRRIDGRVVEVANATSELFVTRYQASQAKQQHLNVFNTMSNGIWTGVIKTL